MVGMNRRTRVIDTPTDDAILQYDNVPVETAARYLGSSTATLYEALQDERVPFGWAVHRNAQWAYHISPGALVRYKREGLPLYKLKDVSDIVCGDVERLIDKKMEVLSAVFQAVGGTECRP